MADVRLHAVDGEHDPALFAEQSAKAAAVALGKGEQLVMAIQQVGDAALGQGDVTSREIPVDLGDAAVEGITQAACQGDDVEAELVVGQADAAFGLGADGEAVAGAGVMVAAADAQA